MQATLQNFFFFFLHKDYFFIAEKNVEIPTELFLSESLNKKKKSQNHYPPQVYAACMCECKADENCAEMIK